MDQPPGNRDLVFRLAGAGTGIVVFVALAGGGVTAARLHALGLPIDATVSVLPHEQVLTAGVRVLSGGLAIAALEFGLLWLLRRTRVLKAGRAHIGWWLLVPVLALGPLLVFTLLQPLTTDMVLVVIGATAVATIVLLLVLGQTRDLTAIGSGFFALVAVYGGVLAFARAYSPPVSLDFADVQLSDGGRTSGYFLGQSSTVVVLAPQVLGHTVGRTVAIQRDQVADLRISRLDTPVRPIGPHPFTHFTVTSLPRSDQPVGRTLLRIMLSAQWKYPPLIYNESVHAWRPLFAAFGKGGELPAGAQVQQTTLEDLNEQTPLFAGKLVRIEGVVLEATPWRDNKPQTVVLRQPGRSRYLATCDVWTASERPYAPKAHVHVEGLVIASGVFVSGGGTARNRVAMACARR